MHSLIEAARNLIPPYAFHVAQRLGALEYLLSHGDASLQELATELSVPKAQVGKLRAVTNLLVHHGYFRLRRERISLTPAARDAAADESLMAYLSWRCCAGKYLENTPLVLQGRMDTIYRDHLYSYLGRHPGEYDCFQMAMASLARLQKEPLLRRLEPVLRLAPAAHILDVGGGSGVVSKWILDAHADVRVSLIDLRITVAERGLSEHVASGRCTIRRLDFLKTAIPSCDIFLMCHVLCNFSNKDVPRGTPQNRPVGDTSKPAS
jgi:hypothetical protein